MSFQQFFMILRGRLGLAAFVFCATVAAVAVLSATLPKRYDATASVVVDVKPDPVSGAMLDALVMPGYLATQRDILMSDRVARKVVQLLKLDAGRGDPRELVKALKKKLDIAPSRTSNVIDITFSASDPAFAAAAANAFAQAYLDTSIELRVDPARQYTRWFGAQDKTLRGNLERAQARLSEFQQKHGLGVTEERVDSEITRLNALAAQLAAAQAEAADAKGKQVAASDVATLPDVVQNPLIVTLKSEIARQDARLQELAGHLGVNHPEYRRTKAEIDSLKGRLAAETRVIASSLRTAQRVNQDKQVELAAAIAAQKKKVLAMREAREQLAALQRDRDIAQKAYENVTQRLTETRLESQFRQTNVAMLTHASAPLDPVFPNPLLNAVAAIFLGTLFALGAAFARELLDRRVHTVEDLAEMLQLPVLGVVQRRKVAVAVVLPRLPAPSAQG